MQIFGHVTLITRPVNNRKLNTNRFTTFKEWYAFIFVCYGSAPFYFLPIKWLRDRPFNEGGWGVTMLFFYINLGIW